MKGKLQLGKQQRNQTLDSVLLSCEGISGFSQRGFFFFLLRAEFPVSQKDRRWNSRGRSLLRLGEYSCVLGSPLSHSSALDGIPHSACSLISPSTCLVAGPWSAEFCWLSAFASAPGPGRKPNLLYIVNPTHPVAKELTWHFLCELLFKKHSQLSALWRPPWVGLRGSGREVQQGGDIRGHAADSLHCTAQTDVTLPSSYEWVTDSRSVMSDSLLPMHCSPPGFSCHWNSPGKNTGVGSHSLLQGIFPTERWKQLYSNNNNNKTLSWDMVY